MRVMRTMPTMKYYDAPETTNFDSRHTLLFKFMYGEHTAQVITTMGGNTNGADLIGGYQDFGDMGLSGPADNEINQKHCIFEESEHNNKEIEQIRFFHDTRPEEVLGLEEAAGYLIGIEIVQYEEMREEATSDEG